MGQLDDAADQAGIGRPRYTPYPQPKPSYRPRYIAVIDKIGGSGYSSSRPDNDWAAFVGDNRDDVIRRALRARNKWGRSLYRVLIGTLDGEVKEPVQYEVEAY